VPSSYISNLVHFVWSTKNRQLWILETWQEDLFAYMGGVLRNKHGKLLRAGGMPDHVHLYTSLPATIAIADIANALKSNSSRWVHEKHQSANGFAWQEGYGAFTVSKSGEASLVSYIDHQQQHHRARDFQAEFIAFLRAHGIAYDERYIWD
jgi:putative transposase